MTLPDESRDAIVKSQEIWNCLVHPPECQLITPRGGPCGPPPPPHGIGLENVSHLVIHIHVKNRWCLRILQESESHYFKSADFTAHILELLSGHLFRIVSRIVSRIQNEKTADY